jgi:glycosyltransferase involved in cell wall biosynthesis
MPVGYRGPMVKLLLVAPTCDGEDVGEALVSYEWAHGLAQRHDVTLLTYYKRGATPASRQLQGLRVIEWQEPALLGRAERLNSMLKPGYFPFHAKVRRWVRRALAAGEHFDIAHQPTPVAMRYPSPLSGFDIPYVIGPVGGSLESPPGFAADDTAPWFVGLRSLDRVRLRRDPSLRHTYERAACVLGIAPYVQDALTGLNIRRFLAVSDVAISDLPDPVDRTSRTGPVRLLFVGRLIRTKGARDAIAAMAQLRDLDVELDIVGDGYDRSACENLAHESGVMDRVHFHGWVEPAEVKGFYARADVFVFPSFREPGGTVTFEAMAAGLPLIVADRGGPANVVDESCGFRLPVLGPEQLARDIAEAVRTLTLDSDLRARMGQAARSRVQRIGMWPGKIERVGRLYDELIEANSRR